MALIGHARELQRWALPGLELRRSGKAEQGEVQRQGIVSQGNSLDWRRYAWEEHSVDKPGNGVERIGIAKEFLRMP